MPLPQQAGSASGSVASLFLSRMWRVRDERPMRGTPPASAAALRSRVEARHRERDYDRTGERLRIVKLAANSFCEIQHCADSSSRRKARTLFYSRTPSSPHLVELRKSRAGSLFFRNPTTIYPVESAGSRVIHSEILRRTGAAGRITAAGRSSRSMDDLGSGLDPLRDRTAHLWPNHLR